jgi:hypothetical protein
MTPPAWKITRDLINDSGAGGGADEMTPSRAGWGQGTFNEGEPRYPFRLFDDDGEHYYSGECNEAAYWADDVDGSLLQAWKWGEYDAGAVHCRVKLTDLEQLDPRAAEILAKYAVDGWVGLFG